MMTPGLQWVSLMLLTRIGWAGRHWALPFLTALVVSARYDRRKGRRHKTFTDYAQQLLVCLRRWLPERDLVVVADGGYAKREFLRHCQNMSKPIVVVTKLRKDASRYQPAPPRRPGQIGRPPGGRRATAQSHGGAGRSRYTMDSLPRHRFRGSTAMVELTSGVALWYHGRPEAGSHTLGRREILGGAPRALCFAMHRHRGGTPADTAVVSAAVAGRGDL